MKLNKLSILLSLPTTALIFFSNSCNSKIETDSFNFNLAKTNDKYQLLDLNIKEKTAIINRMKTIEKNLIDSQLKKEYVDTLNNIERIINLLNSKLKNKEINPVTIKLNNDLNTTFLKLKNQYNDYIISHSHLIKNKFIIDLNMYDSIQEIIKLMNDKMQLDFQKSIGQMSAYDLKIELEDLKIKTSNAKINFVIFYKDKKSIIPIDEHQKLDLLLRLLNDVESNNNQQSNLLFKLLNAAGKKSTLDLFQKYGSDIKDYIDDIIKFMGTLPNDVISEFSSLIEIFENIANSFKDNDLIKQWAINNNQVELVNSLDHILVKFVVNSPH